MIVVQHLSQVIGNFCTQCVKYEIKLAENKMLREAKLITETVELVMVELRNNSPFRDVFARALSLGMIIHSIIVSRELPKSLKSFFEKEDYDLKHPVIEAQTQDEIFRNEASSIYKKIGYLETWKGALDEAFKLYEQSPNETNSFLARKLISNLATKNENSGTEPEIKSPKFRTATLWFKRIRNNEF